MGLRFEICVESIAGVRAALEVGADRIELCTDLAIGGITPSIGLIDAAVALADGQLEVHVLVRPRRGDFVFAPDEVDVMLRDIAAAKRAGVNGLVVGALTSAGEIDLDVSRRLVDATRPGSVTYHRAFDAAVDLDAALDAVVGLGVDRLLTSGGTPTAPEGTVVLARLVGRAGDRLVILPGGGVTAGTAGALVAATGVTELHFSGRARDDQPTPLRERLRAIMTAAGA